MDKQKVKHLIDIKSKSEEGSLDAKGIFSVDLDTDYDPSQNKDSKVNMKKCTEKGKIGRNRKNKNMFLGSIQIRKLHSSLERKRNKEAKPIKNQKISDKCNVSGEICH